MFPTLSVALILGVALSSGAYGLPVGYRVTIIPGKAYDINDTGQVVGEYNGQAYLWTDFDKDLAVDTGEMESLGVLSPKTSRSTRPVWEPSLPATASGVPSATILPPSFPPSGPRSMIQSTVLITSKLCSITTTVLPRSTRRLRT